LRFRVASLADVEALARLINGTFRVEQPFIEGDRTNPDGVRAYMEKGKFLLAEDAAGLAGCVYVELRGDHGYLRPARCGPIAPGHWLGPQIDGGRGEFFPPGRPASPSTFASSVRARLFLLFYRHLGYLETGTAPFAPDVPAKVPCHYILMSKTLV